MLRKRMVLLRRRDGHTAEQFDRYWRTEHVAFITALPGLKEYVQNATVDSFASTPSAPEVDGIVEVWFDDAGLESPAAHTSSAQQADEIKFIGSLTGYTVTARESYEAPEKLWLLSQSPTALQEIITAAVPTEASVILGEPDPDTIVTRRAALASEAGASNFAVVHGLSAARLGEVFDSLRKAIRHSAHQEVRVIRTVSRRFS